MNTLDNMSYQQHKQHCPKAYGCQALSVSFPQVYVNGCVFNVLIRMIKATLKGLHFEIIWRNVRSILRP
jgi:hypothetical protein